MIRLLSILLILIVLVAPGFATTRTAASCSSADVQAAINASADGDTVVIPAGTCQWTSRVSITKAITLQGSGIDVTTLRDGISPRGAMLTISTPTGKNWRLTGMTFTAGSVTGDNWTGVIQATGGSHAFRIDHVKLNDFVSNTSGIGLYGDLWGVIDHSTFLTSRGAMMIHLHHGTWQGIGGYGDNSWAQPTNAGSVQMIYIEDCTFTNTGGQRNIVDAYEGARYAIRNSTFNGANVENHGTDSSQRIRGVRWLEIYHNTFYGNNSSYVNMRSGSGVAFGNTVTSGYGVLVNGQNHRDCGVSGNLCRVSTPWGLCDGTGKWDQNTPGQGGYACIDQVGRGRGTLLSGSSPTPTEWPSQSLEPFYAWNNTLNGAMEVGQSFSAPHIQVGRDMIGGTPKPGYTPLPYPHPLVSGSSSSAPQQPAALQVH